MARVPKPPRPIGPLERRLSPGDVAKLHDALQVKLATIAPFFTAATLDDIANRYNTPLLVFTRLPRGGYRASKSADGEPCVRLDIAERWFAHPPDYAKDARHQRIVDRRPTGKGKYNKKKAAGAPEDDADDIEDVEQEDADELELARSGAAGVQEHATPSVVKMKLRSFVHEPELAALMDRTAVDASIVVAEFYEFAELHIIRLAELGRFGDIGVIDSSFLTHAFNCVTGFTDTRKPRPASFEETRAIFDACRPQGQVPVDFSWLGDLKSELIIVVRTAITKHLRESLRTRVEAYVRWRYPTLSKKMRAQIAYLVTVNQFVASDTGLASGSPEHVLAISIVEHMRALCPIRRWHKNVGENSVHKLLPLLYEMWRHTEDAFDPSDANQRHLRKSRFHLFPKKKKFTVSYIPICSRTFCALVRKCSDSSGEPLANLVRDENRTPLTTTRPSEKVAEDAWREFCSVGSVETAQRQFGAKIITDGVGVSVLLDKFQSIQPSCREADDFDPCLMKTLADGRVPRRVGVDPGFSDVVTVNDQDNASASYSSSRYYHDAKVRLSMRRSKKWNRDVTPMLSEYRVESATPTADAYEDHVRLFLDIVRPMTHHSATKGFRNMRFMRYVHKKRAVNAICDTVAPRDVFTVVGFGDWNGSPGSAVKRRCAGPIQDVRRELARRSDPSNCPAGRASVYLQNIDEFRTSVTCSTTHTRLVGMRAFTHRWDRRTRRFAESPERVRIHKTLHCRNSTGPVAGFGGTWDRDVNAARNIRFLLEKKIRGEPRPGVFCRGTHF